MAMTDEVVERVQALETHVFLQASVGVMVGYRIGYLTNKLGANSLQTIIAEPTIANFVFRSDEKQVHRLLKLRFNSYLIYIRM